MIDDTVFTMMVSLYRAVGKGTSVRASVARNAMGHIQVLKDIILSIAYLGFDFTYLRKDLKSLLPRIDK